MYTNERKGLLIVLDLFFLSLKMVERIRFAVG